MVREKFPVRITPEERDQLEHTVRAGRNPASAATRARILLKTDEGWSQSRGAQAKDCVLPGGPCSCEPGLLPDADHRSSLPPGLHTRQPSRLNGFRKLHMKQILVHGEHSCLNSKLAPSLD